MGLLLLVGLAAGCASKGDEEGARHYRVAWSAERVSDHLPLAASSASVALGGKVSVKTAVAAATEERPAVTEFSASVRRGPKPGVIEVISRATVRQVVKTPKGKLVRQKRTIGALLPMRVGERQGSSAAGDPIAVTVALEKER